MLIALWPGHQQNKPINNLLQVVCVTANDNYLDMLTNQTGDFDYAIEYIKDCALSDVNGDCKLIEKMYSILRDDGNRECAFAPDSKGATIHYYNEKKEHVYESTDAFRHKIANNLQNSYLKGVNYLINRVLDKKYFPSQLLETYDIMEWNRHIYQLSNASYQRKVFSRLNMGELKSELTLVT